MKPKAKGPAGAAAETAKKPKGDKPVLSGIVQVTTDIPLIRDDKPVYTSKGEQVFENKDVGQLAAWLPKPKDGQPLNPMGPSAVGHLTLLGRRGYLELFENDTTMNDRKPVIVGAVYDGGHNKIGEVSLWNNKPSDKKNAPKYHGIFKVVETESTYRLVVWGPKGEDTPF